MNRYREYLNIRLTEVALNGKKTRSNLAYKDQQNIDEQVRSVFIQKFDHTQDMGGSFIVKNKEAVVAFIKEKLKYKVAKNYRSSASCLQFVSVKQRGKQVVRNADFRHKFYCKDVHLQTSISATKEVSIGHKPLINASEFYLDKFVSTVKQNLSRSEASQKFYSVQDEQDFLLAQGQSDLIQ